MEDLEKEQKSAERERKDREMLRQDKAALKQEKSETHELERFIREHKDKEV